MTTTSNDSYASLQGVAEALADAAAAHEDRSYAEGANLASSYTAQARALAAQTVLTDIRGWGGDNVPSVEDLDAAERVLGFYISNAEAKADRYATRADQAREGVLPSSPRPTRRRVITTD